jgi:hypothetical protein
MQTKNSQILYTISTYSLIASLALSLFSFVFGGISFLASFAIINIGLKQRFLEIENTQKTALGILSVFVIMSACLFWANSFLTPRMEEIEESVGKVLLSVLAIILSILLLILFYFSFSYFFSFLSTRFWS